jgi:hypothetical protein
LPETCNFAIRRLKDRDCIVRHRQHEREVIAEASRDRASFELNVQGNWMQNLMMLFFGAMMTIWKDAPLPSEDGAGLVNSLIV